MSVQTYRAAGTVRPREDPRGMDNPTYYIREGDAYANYSATGNTLNVNHPVVRRMIVDSLRYWVEEMHVDGSTPRASTRSGPSWETVGKSGIDASAMIYAHEQREPEQTVNFVTCHDGFTLNHLVSYDQKHNEANGE